MPHTQQQCPRMVVTVNMTHDPGAWIAQALETTNIEEESEDILGEKLFFVAEIYGAKGGAQ